MDSIDQLSDLDQETVIAKTTYINLPGTHTTESEVVTHDVETSNNQSEKAIKFNFSVNERQEPPAIIPTTAANAVAAITFPPTLQSKSSIVPPFRPIPEIPMSPYQPIYENARESACCKVRTIIMEQGSNDSIGTVLEPQLEQTPRRARYVLNFCQELFATLAVCMQVNKDCIFCFLFFAGFMVTASFLTAFFYRAMTLNPQVFQYPVHTGRVYYV